MNEHDWSVAAPKDAVDDPERGIFWGPPDPRTGLCCRWSRMWFDWRNEPTPEPAETGE